MVKILYANFKSSLLHTVDKIGPILVAPLRDQLKRSFDAERLVNIHQPLTAIQTGLCFHVVSHDDATAGSFGPEPHKGKPRYAPSSERQEQQSLANVLDGSVHGPARKTQTLPTPRMKPLNSPPDGRSH